jgi:putative ABC transport system permease protein
MAELALGPMQQALRDILLPMNAKHIDLGNLGGTLTSAIVAGLLTSLLAALVPSARAASEEPADAVRRIPPSLSISLRFLHLGMCLILVAGGLLIITLKEFLPQRVGAYSGLAIIFLGCLLATPLLTDLAARLLQPLSRRLLSVAERLAVDNLSRAPGRTGLVIGALAAGVALMIETAGLIHSNEIAMHDWVQDTMQMGADVREHLQEEFGTFQDFHVVGVCVRCPVPWRDHEGVDLMVVALDAGTYYAANIKRGNPSKHLDLMRRIAQEPGTAVASRNFLVKHGVAVGATVTVKGSRGPVVLRIIGSVVDYGWNQGSLFVDRAYHHADFNTQFVDIYDCYLPADGLEKETFRQQVQQSSWGTEHALFVLTRAELREWVLSLIRRLYSLAYTQQLVVVLVVGLGVAAALLISVLQRRRELGLLRAVGATQVQVLRTVLAEAFLMGAIGTALGLLIGLPLEWYVLRVLMVAEAGFEFPVVYPWLPASFIAALAMGLAALAGVIPAIQAGRLRIAEAIAYE